MSTIENLRKTRIKKLQNIIKAGINPYPALVRRTHKNQEVLDNFGSLSRKKTKVILAGRIRSIREHGGSTFFHVEDGSGQIQIYLKQDKIGKKDYQLFLDDIDIGDFIEAEGTLFKTKKGEKTLEASKYKVLVKSLLPLPEKWHGLKDVEERFRKRYLDLIMNPEVKEAFKVRSKIISEIRRFLNEEGFLEVETPILQPIYGGAAARPFKTHLNALDMDLYLRIAPELYLKRLLVGGFEKVYEIGRNFRNEGMDREHNPEFTMLEFYWAYQEYEGLMKFTEKLFISLLKNIFKKTKIEYRGKTIDFKTPWRRMEFSALLKKFTGIDYDRSSRADFSKKARSLGVKIDKSMGKGEIADEFYKKLCRPNIWQPTFIINHPLEISPLSKKLEKDPAKVARFQLIAGGFELINAFSELNDPVDQRERFEEQEKARKKGLEEAHPMDEDFIEALEHGMPPAAGLGLGIDRLTVLLTDSHALREVILFPTMRPK